MGLASERVRETAHGGAPAGWSRLRPHLTLASALHLLGWPSPDASAARSDALGPASLAANQPALGGRPSRRLTALVAALVLSAGVACDEPPPTAAPSAPPDQPSQPQRADEPADEIEDEAPPAAEAPLDVDSLDQPALEAACFEGSQAACDRLGH